VVAGVYRIRVANFIFYESEREREREREKETIGENSHVIAAIVVH